MTSTKPKVTVYIPCHNYGRFLAESVESVISQIFHSWELIIINDGSSDDTDAIARSFREKYPAKITYLSNEKPKGLRACANAAIERARGEYVMRLDADDFLDESALLVMTSFLDQHPDIALVYPNYSYIDENGKVLYLENRKKIGTEVKVLNLPAHGACTMVRRRVLKSIGGYDEKYSAQDGYELWLKVINKHQVGNVSTPLFFYRQHHRSMTQDESRIISSRQKIKRDLAAKLEGPVKPRIVAVIPAKNTYEQVKNIVFKKFRGKALIDYTLDAAAESGVFEKILVTTDDEKVAHHCAKRESVLTAVRDPGMSNANVTYSQILFDAVTRLERDFGVYPDILVLLSVNSPLPHNDLIRTALDSLLLYNTDSVISVYEDNSLHFVHGKNGMELLNEGMLKRVRMEREALYTFTGALTVVWRDVITEHDIFGRKVGHVVIPRDESLSMRYLFDMWMVKQVMNSKNRQ